MYGAFALLDHSLLDIYRLEAWQQKRKIGIQSFKV